MIYDCFTFFNELDLLEIRLNILDDYVDAFVICEGDKTFRGKPKPFHFKENEERFEKWLDKIIYIEAPMPQRDPWAMEEFQRNWITMGLGEIRSGDLIFISDLDEIWNPLKLDEIAEKSFEGPIKIEQSIFYYYLNLRLDMRWSGTVAVRGIDFVGPQFHRTMGSEPYISESGWHFSYLGDQEEIAYKIQSFSHSELDTPQFTNQDWIKNCLENKVDIFGRDIELNIVEIDESYPEYIVENMEKWGRYIL